MAQHEYEFSTNPDGTFNVLAVPIFGEVPAKNAHGKPEITEDWLKKAVRKDRERRTKDSYFAPTHVLHHEPGVQPERAGHMELTGVKRMLYEGQKIMVVLANLISIPRAIFERIQKGELPYRSVEILNPQEPEISSLALLDSEVPFFRFPMLAVGNHARRLTNSPAVLACAKSEVGRTYLFRAISSRGDELMSEIATTETVVTHEARFDAIEAQLEKQNTGLAELTALLTEQFAAHPVEKTENTEHNTGHEGPVTTPVIPVSPQEINGTTEEVETDFPSVKGGNFDAKLEARVMLLETNGAATAKKEATASRFAAAMEQLKDYNIAESAEARLKEIAGYGQTELDAVVEVFKESLSKDPAPTLAAATAGAAAAAADSDEVAVYALKSPEEGERARALETRYEAAKAATGMRATKAQFLKINMTQPGQE